MSSVKGDDVLEDAFIVIFVIALCFAVGSWIARYIKNESSPIVKTKARLIDKKRDTMTGTDANGDVSASETLYLIFGLDTGSTMSFSVGGRIYRNVPKNEWGTLTFQGTRFLRFESASGVVEK